MTPLRESVSEGECHCNRKELPGVVNCEGVLVEEDDAIPDGHAQVAGHLPVEEDIRLPPQESLIIGWLIDGCIPVHLAKEEEIHPDLKALKLSGCGEWKC